MSKSKLPKTSVSSASRFSRLRWLGTPFRRVGRWFSFQPRVVQIGLVVVMVVGLATGVYYGNSYRQKRGTAKDVAAAWSEYGHAANKSNMEGIRAALDRVHAIDPADPTATRYKAMLDRGEADPDVPELVLVLFHEHLRHSRLTEATREAEKWLAKYPKDWHARCVVAYHALTVSKDPALAERHFNQLGDPEDPASNLNLDALRYAIMVSQEIGRDRSALRNVIVRRLLPNLRRESTASVSATTKLALLQCYLEPFADPGALAELGQYWAVADKLAESALTDAVANGEVRTLTGLALLWRPMRAALARLREHDPARLPDDRLIPLVKAVDDRTRRAWQAVREKAPDRVEAYRGLAELALQENNPQGARLQILDGLSACGDRAELLELLLLVTRSGTDENLHKTFNSLLEAAQTAKNDPAKWCLVADAAIALERHEDALKACRNARLAKNDFPQACQTEAWLWIRTGEFVHARKALVPLGEEALRTRPGLVQLHARTLAETLWVLIDDEFNAVREAQAKLKPKTSMPSIAFLLGVFSATPTKEKAEWVATRAAQVLADDSSANLARRIRAAALYQLAELAVTSNPKDGSPVWNEELVTVAMRAFEEMPQDERTEPGVVAAIAALQLKGQGHAATALRTAGVLRAVEASLNSWQLEVLGTVLTANGKPSEAVQVLERAAKLHKPNAGLWAALAIAYHKNKQPDDARAALDRAANTPNRTAREQAEFVFAKQQLLKENP